MTGNAVTTSERMVIAPQPGPQTTFAHCSADIALLGGKAFGGKTFSLLLEPTRHIGDPQFGTVIFRRTYGEIMDEGGMWDESFELYPYLNAAAVPSRYEWRFPTGARVRFAHLEHAKDRLRWKGAQIGLIEFDQWETFLREQVFYLLSRNRSSAGIWPYIRATANPVPPEDEVGGWLHELVGWWIGEDGLAIPERSGVLRWFIVEGDELVWGASAEELQRKYGHEADPLSFTFIPAGPEDNPIGMANDPSYVKKLKALGRVDRARLLGGNWLIREAAGTIFSAEDFKYAEGSTRFVKCVRCWDRAATPGDAPNAPRASATAGAKVGEDQHGVRYLDDMKRVQLAGHLVKQLIIDTARDDGYDVEVAIFQDPGAAGKAEAEDMVRTLTGLGFTVHVLPTVPPRRVVGTNVLEGPNAKVTYAKPWASALESGQFLLRRADWNAAFIRECVNFDGTGVADQVDATSGANAALAKRRRAGVF